VYNVNRNKYALLRKGGLYGYYGTLSDYLVRLLPYKLMLEWDYENRRPKELKRSEKN
jgi:hypothetical protein